jgi:hypothetical protein
MAAVGTCIWDGAARANGTTSQPATSRSQLIGHAVQRPSEVRGQNCLRGGHEYHAGMPTVRRLLDYHSYRLHANTKQLERGATHPERDRQFESIATQRQAFRTTGQLQISVDAKRKELIGRFKKRRTRSGGRCPTGSTT